MLNKNINWIAARKLRNDYVFAVIKSMGEYRPNLTELSGVCGLSLPNTRAAVMRLEKQNLISTHKNTNESGHPVRVWIPIRVWIPKEEK